MTKRQRIDLERDKLMDEDKNIGINIMIKMFNNLNQSLQHQMFKIYKQQ